MEGQCNVAGCDRSAITRGYCEMHYRRVLKTGKPGPPDPLRAIGACEVDGCNEEVDAKSLCHGHYQRLLRGVRDVESPLRQGAGKCSVDGCERPHQAKGFCGTHYKRVQTHGGPRAEVPIREVEGTGFIKHGYWYVGVPQESRHLTGGASTTAEHRLVMAMHLGRALTSDEQVHHINGIRTDNRLENLELWSTSHPNGRRIEDLLEFCQAMLDRYGDEFGLLEGPARSERS